MRFLPTSLHGVIDYLWGLALLSTPWLFGFADVPAAKWTAVIFGLVLLCHKLTRRAIVGRSIMRRRVMNLPIPSETREARFAAYVD
ncbi:SPW repeat protein, partial [Microvirga tunisiensis]